jgi:hypothetical protein
MNTEFIGRGSLVILSPTVSQYAHPPNYYDPVYQFTETYIVIVVKKIAPSMSFLQFELIRPFQHLFQLIVPRRMNLPIIFKKSFTVSIECAI